jgi:hypothetical protein
MENMGIIMVNGEWCRNGTEYCLVQAIRIGSCETDHLKDAQLLQRIL